MENAMVGGDNAFHIIILEHAHRAVPRVDPLVRDGKKLNLLRRWIPTSGMFTDANVLMALPASRRQHLGVFRQAMHPLQARRAKVG
jgi:hypothetical protein